MLGVLGWAPKDFWASTPYECSCAYVGWCKSNGAGPWAEPRPEEVDVDEWRASIQELKARFPDTTRVRPKKPSPDKPV